MSDLISSEKFLKFSPHQSSNPASLQDGRVKRYLPLGCIVNELKTGQGVKKFGIYPWIHQYLALTTDKTVSLYVNFSICKMGVGRKGEHLLPCKVLRLSAINKQGYIIRKLG